MSKSTIIFENSKPNTMNMTIWEGIGILKE